MAEDTRSFEEVKAEQDRLWIESASVAEPEGYAEWFRAQVEIGLTAANDPNSQWFTQEEVEAETEAQIRRWREGERKSA